MQSASRWLYLFPLVAGLSVTSGLRADDTLAGPYLSLGAGANRVEPDNTNIIGPPRTAGLPSTNTPSKFTFGTGYDILGAAGWHFGNGFRAELEGGWRQSPVHRVNGTAWTGGQQVLSLMGNAYYDFHTPDSDSRFQFTPYIGGGVGVGRERFYNVSNRSIPGSPIFSGHDSGFQWQAIGGVSMPLSERIAAFVEYRYISLSNSRIGSRSDPISRVVDFDNHSHNVVVGVRFSFGGSAPKATQAAASSAPPPPPPPPATQAPPPPPPVPEKVLAFFDFDHADLRPDAKETVRQAAEFAKNNNKVRINVTGHTDTVGTAEYNMALSKRRAMAVKKELIRLGIPADEIAVAWKGKSDLLVQTADGVKEPQNRRVEIVYE